MYKIYTYIRAFVVFNLFLIFVNFNYRRCVLVTAARTIPIVWWRWKAVKLKNQFG